MIRDIRAHLEATKTLAHRLNAPEQWRRDVYDYAQISLKCIPVLPETGQLVPDVGAIVEPMKWASVDGRTGQLPVAP